MKYATITSAGAIEVRTDSSTELPQGAIGPLTDDQYAGLICGDLTVVNGELTASVAFNIFASLPLSYFIDSTYRDVDAIYADAVGNRTPEYTAAEVDAQSYKDAGYAGAVPYSVQCFADHNPTMTAQTPQWAADQILARASALRSAQTALRSGRFVWQEAMRDATTPEELATAVAGWDALVASTRASLGL